MHNTDTHSGASFSVKNRIARVIWNAVYLFLFRFSPTPLHGWRSFLLRLFGGKVGKGVHVYPGAKIWAPWNVELKDQCGIANDVILYSQGHIKIGARSVISQGSHICAGTHDYTRKGFPLITMPITIGDEVWIAAECFIHPGVTIEDGAVVGARSVVTKDLPRWMVCSGHPCQPIKQRILE
ncbi:WcaF family extracellular polysaccharide biosynthesis acetyltransferase [Terrimonas sp. NA20]|uniref:WcaF family extracellular polysaccharide biosynthesis acetyltransferase n=1 Tax=Terrimonas ginsenosidimutans TaxID=2908004 RepID=A0ABS9L0D0_9BACT|nr:WcaF family extracellular polysaccharide biosynthesis acetyltransferase [Terrimonas ginsenosidimutans]MCG2618082.1 WcaF family extracellular polysaccharide biosynthesis acetyltransferase [Terrimonas ginsenosidimutans]